MQVEALANSLHIRFLAPKIAKEHETWTMRNIYNSWVYNVQYWKNGSDEKVSLANRTYFKYRLPFLCPLLVWSQDNGERRPGSHLVRVLQGGSTLRSRGSKTWASERQSFPVWQMTGIFPDSGKRAELTSKMLVPWEQAFLSPKGSCRRRQSWLSSWLGNLESAKCGDQLTDTCSMACTLCPHPPQNSHIRGQAALPPGTGWTVSHFTCVTPLFPIALLLFRE